MYAQKTVIQVPIGSISELRRLIQEKYLPVVRARPGFLGAYLLEQTDDEDSAELLMFWDSHAAVENFQRTGVLQASIQSLALDLPGLRIHREGYIVRLAVGSLPMPQAIA
ncbi:MAG: antibiotic biosynthesis monooxygenase [Anaerolineae bacterium]|nr:antibiotic biosynthesis monooxygenase [Anaerolineae bacterium]